MISTDESVPFRSLVIRTRLLLTVVRPPVIFALITAATSAAVACVMSTNSESRNSTVWTGPPSILSVRSSSFARTYGAWLPASTFAAVPWIVATVGAPPSTEIESVSLSARRNGPSTDPSTAPGVAAPVCVCTVTSATTPSCAAFATSV